MTEPKRKSKMISIRLSPEEYESLRALFPALGVRSVSEFARGAMQRFLQSPSNGENSTHDLDSRVRVLDNKLNRLESEVSQLSRMIGRKVLLPDED